MVINHTAPKYRRKWNGANYSRYNGAYYYSIEICENIIPLVDTDRNWVTINVPELGALNHSIVFIHNNKKPELYDWLSIYKDLILVCGVPETCAKVAHLGTSIYLPLSVNVEQVRQYRVPRKIHDTAFVGRKPKRDGITFPEGTDVIENLPRAELLMRMAEYKKVYAVGRTAIEAKVLGCEILPYDPRFPDVDRWKIVDNKDAAKMLQKLLDEIDKGGKGYDQGQS